MSYDGPASWYIADDLVEEKVGEIQKLTSMLHEVFAVAVDTGGQTEEENREILDRAQALLKEYGVEV